MADHPSDSELADMGDDAAEDYALAPSDHKPPEVKLPREYEEAVRKAEEELNVPPPAPPLRKFQFTIRDMLVLTTVVAFLMGLIVSINRGMSVFLMYSVFFLIVMAVWFVRGLWTSGYWRKPEHEEHPPDETAAKPIEPTAEPSLLAGYSYADLALGLSAFALLMSLSSLLPGDHKIANAAGVCGFFTLVGLVWLASSEDHRRPTFILFWWLMFAMYLLTSAAVLVVG